MMIFGNSRLSSCHSRWDQWRGIIQRWV